MVATQRAGGAVQRAAFLFFLAVVVMQHLLTNKGVFGGGKGLQGSNWNGCTNTAILTKRMIEVGRSVRWCVEGRGCCREKGAVVD